MARRPRSDGDPPAPDYRDFLSSEGDLDESVTDVDLLDELGLQAFDAGDTAAMHAITARELAVDPERVLAKLQLDRYPYEPPSTADSDRDPG